MNWNQARETLESLGFVPKPQFVDSLEPADRVLSVDGAGTKRPEGSDVRVEVSNGALMHMPDITHKNHGQALSALRDAGWEGSESKLITGEPVDTAVVTDQGARRYDPQGPRDPGALLRVQPARPGSISEHGQFRNRAQPTA